MANFLHDPTEIVHKILLNLLPLVPPDQLVRIPEKMWPTLSHSSSGISIHIALSQVTDTDDDPMNEVLASLGPVPEDEAMLGDKTTEFGLVLTNKWELNMSDESNIQVCYSQRRSIGPVTTDIRTLRVD